MPYVRLNITVPEEVWIGSVSRAYPNTRFRVLAATADEETGIARLEVFGPKAATVCDEIRTYDSVTDLTVFEAGPEQRRVQVETTVPLVLTVLQASGVPLKMPVEVNDGELTLEATVPQRHLSQLGENLNEFDISYSVERIQQTVESNPLLTDRQRWLLHEAIDSGYYDSPREATLTELADALDIAKSTCSEVLHRAEESVLKDFVRQDQDERRGVSARAN
jgi:hypothetical protein